MSRLRVATVISWVVSMSCTTLLTRLLLMATPALFVLSPSWASVPVSEAPPTLRRLLVVASVLVLLLEVTTMMTTMLPILRRAIAPRSPARLAVVVVVVVAPTPTITLEL